MKELIRKITHFLVLKSLPFCKRVRITGRRSEEIYLVRYILLSTKWFSVYIHRFMRSDNDVVHDHPWNFFTYVVTKGYMELSLFPDYNNKGLLKHQLTDRTPGSIAYRKAECLHRVILKDEPYSEYNENNAPLTICFILRRRRIWGFVKHQQILNPKTQQEMTVGYTWINWKDYLNEEHEGIE